MTTILSLIKKNYFLVLLIFIFIFHNAFFNFLANLHLLTKKQDNPLSSEINLLKEENKYLKEELHNLTKLKSYAQYNYSLTRLCYREMYANHDIYILGGKDKNYQENYAVINDNGLIGLIITVNDTTSKVKLLTGIPNLSVRINDTYGTLSAYEDNLLVITNISNYSQIKLNDEVYTSSLGTIKEHLFIGSVYKIEDQDVSKKIYVKTKVDFNNLNYLYVVGGL